MTDERGDLEGRAGIDGDDPMAPVGPELCQAPPEDVNIEPGERSGPPHQSQYEPIEELQESFLGEELATPMSDDGLPDHGADAAVVGTHPFTLESVCCTEDDRTYVEVFREDNATALRRARLDRRASSGREALGVGLKIRSRYSSDGAEHERRTFKPDRVVQRWGTGMVEDGADLIPVRPARPRCRHYKRQHFANDDQPVASEPGHNLIFRMCTHPARRSIGGAAMSLTNEAIYGCDFRDPPDSKCTGWLDNHDQTKLSKRPDLVRLPMFGLAGEEVHEEDSLPPVPLKPGDPDALPPSTPDDPDAGQSTDDEPYIMKEDPES